MRCKIGLICTWSGVKEGFQVQKRRNLHLEAGGMRVGAIPLKGRARSGLEREVVRGLGGGEGTLVGRVHRLGGVGRRALEGTGGGTTGGGPTDRGTIIR